ncbi:hypothetical protein GQX74_007822 [Glossina fuscipes]|nr:hypothetical protein GQX74_007822 [Glossina fuscipes]
MTVQEKKSGDPSDCIECLSKKHLCMPCQLVPIKTRVDLKYIETLNRGEKLLTNCEIISYASSLLGVGGLICMIIPYRQQQQQQQQQKQKQQQRKVIHVWTLKCIKGRTKDLK